MKVEETRGRVSRIWQNETRSGKPYWVLSIQSDDGEFVRYSVWNWKMLEGIHEGEIITYKFQRKGSYNNITEISKSEKPAPASEELLDYQMGGRIPEIGRMSAIKSATQLLSGYSGDPEEKILKTLEAAKEFEKYILGAKEAEVVKDQEIKVPEKRGKKAKKEKTSEATKAQEVGVSSVPGSDEKSKEDLPF